MIISSNIKQSDDLMKIKDKNVFEVSQKISSLEKKNNVSIYIKILLNYLQTISIVKSLDLKWPTWMYNYLSSFSTVGNFSQEISFQCDLYNFHIKLEEIYFKTIFICILPIFIFISSGAILLAIYLWQKKSQFARFVVIIIVSSIFLQPNIVNILLDSLICKEIENESLLKFDLHFDCYEESFLFW